MLFEHQVPLAPLTTLGIGGPARRFVRVTSQRELIEALASDDRVMILGGGSNVVVGDAGWDGLVIQLGIPGIEQNGDVVTVGAGVVWDDFVAEMIAERRAGIECLSGIPGLVGATPIQNVGAYGQEVSETIVSVVVYDRELAQLVTLPPERCGFAYRTSMFKGSARWIVTQVAFRLPERETSAAIRYPELQKALGGDHAPLEAVRDTVIALRRGKGMVVDPGDPESRSAGSFFTNPIIDADTANRIDGAPKWPQPDGRVKLSAAWLIERAGFTKGYTAGCVGISKKHALALVNRGGATATELLALARTIQDGVRERLGIELVPEPVIVQ